MPPPSTTQDAPPEVLTAEEAGELLRLSAAQVRRLARAGDIPAARVGGAWRFTRTRILELLNATEVPA